MEHWIGAGSIGYWSMEHWILVAGSIGYILERWFVDLLGSKGGRETSMRLIPATMKQLPKLFSLGVGCILRKYTYKCNYIIYIIYVNILIIIMYILLKMHSNL